MNGNSKRERLDSFIRRAVREEVHEMVFDEARRGNAEAAKMLAEKCERLAAGVGYRVTLTYSMLELDDIMRWRKRAQP